MHHRIIPLAGIAIACLLGLNQDRLGIANEDNHDPAASSGVAGVTLRDETSGTHPEDILGWVVKRYEQAGLHLPDIEVIFHPSEESMEDCAFHPARWTSHDAGHRIDICTDAPESRRRLLLHELAHAWSHEHLTKSQRLAFLDLRGLKSWNGPGADWYHRGSEHAAELVKWGLNILCTPQNMLEGEEHASLETAFESLTGVEPLCQVAHTKI
jgi:hypothetical protein